ncbi:MBL fold metallo-hydrolase [Candidatus Bathyarchaeota archaeon]|nr:MBL fold metallo-hydrolase [Candidatus Bathyarchaeota archaeon]
MSWRQILPGIHEITLRSDSWFQPSVNVYFLECSNSGGLLVDAGYANKRSFANFLRIFTRLVKHLKDTGKLDKEVRFDRLVKKVVITHDHHDHASGAWRLKEYFPAASFVMSKGTNLLLSGVHLGKPLGIHGRIREILMRIFNKLLGMRKILPRISLVCHGDAIACGNRELTVILSRGHSFEQLLLHEKKQGILFSSDLVLADISTWLGPPNSDYLAYHKTMNFLSSLDNVKIMLPAHGKIIKNPKGRINELRHFRELRELQIIDYCKKKPRSISSISWALYKSRGIGTVFIAMGMVKLVTHYLVAMGRLSKKRLAFCEKYIAVDDVPQPKN